MARAIVARPKILLLDEATSALDNITQSIVTRSLGTLRATRIVIAHRLTTIQHADRIFVLDQGRVVEAGSFDELMAANGKFAQLAQRQLL
jgi:ABC-type multidrug transport system fused ATPase/permease subunit